MDIDTFLSWKKTFYNNRDLQKHLEFNFLFLWEYKFLADTSWKKNLFELQREYCELDTWTCIEDIDNHFFQEIEKSFRARKVYLNNVFGQYTFPISL